MGWITKHVRSDCHRVKVVLPCVELLVYWKAVEGTATLISRENPWILSIQSLEAHQCPYCWWSTSIFKWSNVDQFDGDIWIKLVCTLSDTYNMSSYALVLLYHDKDFEWSKLSRYQWFTCAWLFGFTPARFQCKSWGEAIGHWFITNVCGRWMDLWSCYASTSSVRCMSYFRGECTSFGNHQHLALLNTRYHSLCFSRHIIPLFPSQGLQGEVAVTRWSHRTCLWWGIHVRCLLGDGRSNCSGARLFIGDGCGTYDGILWFNVPCKLWNCCTLACICWIWTDFEVCASNTIILSKPLPCIFPCGLLLFLPL